MNFDEILLKMHGIIAILFAIVVSGVVGIAIFCLFAAVFLL